MTRLIFAVSLLLLSAISSASPPSTFTEAKAIARQKVFYDQNTSVLGDLYCGCQWRWVGRSGGRIDTASCGYEVRKQQVRGERSEWEHIVPAWTFGHQRKCWQNGGRKNCVASDPVFREMEADLFNLYPSVGELNSDRANFNFGMISGSSQQYGQCSTKVDFKGRVAEPRDEVKGLVARSTFYMFDRYALRMSRQQQQLLMAWNNQHPVTPWEVERNERIRAIVGHGNPFVTGERRWSLGHKPRGEGLTVEATSDNHGHRPLNDYPIEHSSNGAIIGNRNSRVYHLSTGCPSYDKVAPKNQVHFVSEHEAMTAGYRKAGNCS
ncbi:endonuclease [Stutzerimonas stutzeri]|uniref:endonuclease n=1 Tax=Stutzerimonas stutzeri TaxID=316 RepID=UPI0015E47FD8|nr:endonuclease [Stutzerimonas stutzeri]MBA1278804.1 deoxyribonuclease I [Stutzerimonas stutzeri]